MMQWLMGGIVVLALIAGGVVLTSQRSNDVTEKDTVGNGAMMERDVTQEEAQKDAMMNPPTSGEGVMEKDAMMGKEVMTDPSTGEGGVMMEKGSYEPYAAAKLAKAAKGDVVLFFRASWCPTCRALDADIKANTSNIPGGVTILDVNYDTETVLKQKYGVTYQHTLVQVDASGNLITKWSGGLALDDLLSKIQ